VEQAAGEHREGGVQRWALLLLLLLLLLLILMMMVVVMYGKS
jgi:hypothetical protein